MPQRPVPTYSKTPLNKVNRYPGRASYDTTTIHTIVNTSLISHISFVDLGAQPPPAPGATPNETSTTPPSVQPPIPTILPMIARMGSFTHPSSDISDPLDLYLHTSISTRIVKLISSYNASTTTSTAPQGAGFPLTISATKVDGIVLATTPFNHSYNYRSAVLFGKAFIVADREEKLYAAKLVTELTTFVGNWESCRTPPSESELCATAFVRVVVEGASAKVRVGESGDDRKCREDEELMDRVWTGVVPVFEKFGDPVESSYNGFGGRGSGKVPEYILRGVEERERREREYAVRVAGKQEE